jgi:hypothetical protein
MKTKSPTGRTRTPPDRAPVLSAEIFTIPLDAGRYLVYAPLRRAAFIANATVVNSLADLKAGMHDRSADPDGSLLEFLRRLGMVDAAPERPPVTTFHGDRWSERWPRSCCWSWASRSSTTCAGRQTEPSLY